MASNGRADNRMKGGWERQTKPMGPTAPKPIGPRTTPATPKSAGDLALKLLGGKSPRRI